VPTLRSIRLVTWGNAWLEGTVGLDDLLDGVRGDDVAHTVALPAREYPPTQPGFAGDTRQASALEALPVPLALAELRRRGTSRLRLALPAPGDPLGLSGPPTTTEAILAVGEAVLAEGAGLALLPAVIGAGVQWSVLPAIPPAAVIGRGEAERALGEGLLAAARELAGLDVARANPDLARVLATESAALRGDELPPTVGNRGAGLIARAARLRTVLQIALADDGGSRTSAEARARRSVLAPLDPLVRRALVAACEPDPG
jgi:hypothetical protein